ncbi:LysR family transcriptional regulator [Citrobacter freundii]|nr:LysR family transcriptional regulator [Citrobacter freundii]
MTISNWRLASPDLNRSPIIISLLPLGDISWQFVVAQNHPLASHPVPVLSDDMLRRYPAINIEDTSRTLTRRVAWLLSGQKEIKSAGSQH